MKWYRVLPSGLARDRANRIERSQGTVQVIPLDRFLHARRREQVQSLAAFRLPVAGPVSNWRQRCADHVDIGETSIPASVDEVGDRLNDSRVLGTVTAATALRLPRLERPNGRLDRIASLPIS